jgi:hypothetical protein
MMSAVARLKQAVKSATEAHDVKQLSSVQPQQPQKKKAPAATAGTFIPCATGNSWDFHPLTGSLMDAVLMMMMTMMMITMMPTSTATVMMIKTIVWQLQLVSAILTPCR